MSLFLFLLCINITNFKLFACCNPRLCFMYVYKSKNTSYSESIIVTKTRIICTLDYHYISLLLHYRLFPYPTRQFNTGVVHWEPRCIVFSSIINDSVA